MSKAHQPSQHTMAKGVLSGQFSGIMIVKDLSLNDFSVAKLVEAAVTARAFDRGLLDVGQEVAREQQQLLNVQATSASLPTIEVARQLVES